MDIFAHGTGHLFQRHVIDVGKAQRHHDPGLPLIKCPNGGGTEAQCGQAIKRGRTATAQQMSQADHPDILAGPPSQYPRDTNAVTAKTVAAFEPALDYCVVKIPRWPFDKFVRADRTLGTQMKATGEVMAIGNNFEHAMMKAVSSIELGMDLSLIHI